MFVRAKTAVRNAVFVGTLVIAIGLGVASAAPAAAKVPVWSIGGTPIPAGTEVPFNSHSLHGLTLKWTSGGVPFYVQCSNLYASGRVQASFPGGSGLVTESATFKQCLPAETNYEEPYGCTVPYELPVFMTPGKLTNTPYLDGGLSFGQVNISVSITNCDNKAYDGKWEFTGLNVTGTQALGAWPGEILFPAGTRFHIYGGGNTSEVEFGMGVQKSDWTPINISEQ